MLFRRFASCLSILLLSALLLLRPALAGELTPDGLRGLAREWIQVTGVEPAERPEKMREFLFGHRGMLKLLANAKDLSQTLGQSELVPGEVLDDLSQRMIRFLQRQLRKPPLLAVLDEIRPEHLALIPEDWLNAAARETSQAIEQIHVSSQKGFQALLNPETGITVSEPNLQKMIQTVLPKYFDSLPTQDKRRILVGLLELPVSAPWQEQVGAVIQNANPLVQKVFQLVGREVKSEALQEVLIKLQAEVKPVPFEQIRGTIEARYGEKLENLFSEFSEKPLNAGTIGQVHLARLKSTGEEVVVKVLRPGAKEAIQREIDTLLRVAPDDSVRSIIKKLGRNILKELDFRLEAKNLKMGAAYVDAEKGIGIARLHPKMKAYEDVLVLERAPGKPISKYTGPELAERGRAVYQLLNSWFEKAMFGNGFFHGDLHPGNMFLDIREDQDAGYLLTLIDFGNAARLTRRQQRAFVRLAAATLLGAENGVYESLKSLTPVPPEAESALREAIARALAGKDSPQDKIALVLKSAEELGVDLPEEFLAFYRGMTFLEQELSEINRLLGEMDPAGKMPRYSSMKAYMKVLASYSAKAIPASLLSKKASRRNVLSRELLRALLRDLKDSPVSLTDYCQLLYQRAFGRQNPAN